MDPTDRRFSHSDKSDRTWMIGYAWICIKLDMHSQFFLKLKKTSLNEDIDLTNLADKKWFPEVKFDKLRQVSDWYFFNEKLCQKRKLIVEETDTLD